MSFFGVFLCASAATRGQYLALGKAWRSCCSCASPSSLISWSKFSLATYKQSVNHGVLIISSKRSKLRRTAAQYVDTRSTQFSSCINGVNNRGPNLQNVVRWTYENVTKKSDIRKVYEKTPFSKTKTNLTKNVRWLISGLRKTSNTHAEICTKNLRNRNLWTSDEDMKILRKYVRSFVN